MRARKVDFELYCTSLGYSEVLREQLMVANRSERKVNLKFIVIGCRK